MICYLFKISAEQVCSIFKTVVESLSKILDAKKEEDWEGIGEQYEKYSAFLEQVFQYRSGLFSIISLYVQTFSVFRLKSHLVADVTNSIL